MINKLNNQITQYPNPFDNQDITTYTPKTFGESVRERRQQLGLTGREVAKRIGMSPIYLCEIEKSSRPAPSGLNSKIDYMSALATVLQLTDEQKAIFNIMGEFSAMKKAKFMGNYFFNNPSAFKFFMIAVNKNWSNEEWEKLYTRVFETNE